MPRRTNAPLPEDPLITQKKTAVSTLTDRFCETHLNAEYKKLTRKLIERMAKENPSPLLRGRPENWAAGIVHAIGSANFLFDKSFKPYISAADLAAAFGVSPTTASQKASGLRERYPLDFPNTEFATKRLSGMAGNLMDTLAQSGLFLQDDGVSIQMPSPDGSTILADQFRTKRRSSKPTDEFVDQDRPVMNDFYDLTELYEGDSPPPILIKKLEQLITADPDFYDSYFLLADIYDEQDAPEKAAALRETSFQRALTRITDKNGTWPKSLEWGWLENRHIIRALLNGALQRWETGDTDAALDLLRKLLHSNPKDNIGARNYLLAIRLGETLEQHEAQFETPDGYLDANKMWQWFDENYPKFPDEFTEWKKQVDAINAE